MTNSTDIEQENRPPHGRYRLYFLLASLALIIGLLLLVVNLRGAQPGTLNQKITMRQTYLDILSEPHTGLRLARLKDFIAHTAPNVDTGRAKTRRNTLDIYEQNAWASLTDTLYNVGKTSDEKIKAVAHYKTNWGAWNRQAHLPKLLTVQGHVPTDRAELHKIIQASTLNTSAIDGQDLPNYTPRNRSSKYAKGRVEIVLAGGVFTNITAPIVETFQPLPITENRPLRIEPVRIKFAKRPRYPRPAFRKGISGQITLALDINERGQVVRTTVVSAEAPRYKDKFIRAAKRAAMASKFHPKTEAGQAVATSRYVRKYKFAAGG